MILKLRSLLAPLCLLLFTFSGLGAQTVFRYSFTDAEPLPGLVTDVGPAGNNATGLAGSLLSPDIPSVGVPADAGDSSLDSSAMVDSGVVTETNLLLSNDKIADAEGFTMEAWFKWNGGGSVNSIVDYAGTEKIVIDERGGAVSGEVEMLISGTPRTSIGVASAGEWHYVAVVFDTLGGELNGDGTINGQVTVYFDSLAPAGVFPMATKDNFGDSLDRPIGIGQHPRGFSLDFFDGLVFEPRVTLGVLGPDDLLFEGTVPAPASTLLHYSLSENTALPTVLDGGPAMNDGTAGPQAVLSEMIPAATPVGAGNRSLSSSGGTRDAQTGIVTDAPLLLSNAAIAAAAGFTMETWFNWNGGGAVNALIDYAGTEKLIVNATTDPPGEVQMVINDGQIRIPIGPATPGTWHYAAVVFTTGGAPQNDDDTITGTVKVYLDSLVAVSTTPGITKSNFGDSLARPIGIGQHPIGFDDDFFDGLVYEPKVGLGAIDLSFVEQPPPPPELFGYWAMEEDSPDEDAEDSSGNGLDGIYLLGANPDVDGAPGFGSGVAFDGTDQGVIDLGADSPLGTLTADFSIVAWMFPTDLTGKNRIMGSLQPNGWGFGPVNANVLQVTTFGVKDYNASVPILANEWTHVAVVLDIDADATFYVNGESIGTVPAGGPARPSLDNFYIGRASNAAEFFTGVIDEVAVFKGSLTQDNILRIIDEGVLGDISPPKPVFKRGDTDASSVVDISDPIYNLTFQFVGGIDAFACEDAADVDNSGVVDISDPIYNLTFQFVGGIAPPPAPGPTVCGPDPDDPEDDLGCESYPAAACAVDP